MITRGKDLELQRLRSDVQELSNALYMAWPYVIDSMVKMAQRGEYTAKDREANAIIEDAYQRIAIPRVDAGREDAA